MARKLKILMFSNIFGGKNTFIHNELIHLCNDYHIKYLALEEIYNPYLKEYFNCYEIIPWKSDKFRRKLQWWLWKSDLYLSFNNPKFSKNLAQVVDDFQPDLIHLHFGYEALKFLDNYYVQNIPIVIHFHGYGASAMFKKKSYRNKLKKYIFRKNVYQIYVSSFMEDRFSSFGMKTERTKLIRYGVDLNKFNLEEFVKESTDELILTQVSSQVEKKGIPYTLNGYKLFLDRNKGIKSKLYITGEIQKENIQTVEELGLQNYVVFTGLLDQDQVREVLTKTDIFIHPSVTSSSGDEEGIPNAIIEAVALKLPVISTYHSGIPELIEQGKNGLLVEERNAEQIRKAIEEICLWDKLNYDSKSYLKSKKFDINSHLYEIRTFYESLT